MRTVLLAVSLLAVTACDSVFGPGERESLRRAQDKWEAAGIKDYNYEMRASCYCPPESYQWAVVEVRNDVVVGGHYLDGRAIPALELIHRRTVNQLFDTAMDRGDWIKDVEFEFDDELGYPTLVVLEAKSNIADGGIAYEARNLVKVPVATD